MNITWSKMCHDVPFDVVIKLMYHVKDERGQIPDMKEEVPDWVQMFYNNRIERKNNNE